MLKCSNIPDLGIPNTDTDIPDIPNIPKTFELFQHELIFTKIFELHQGLKSFNTLKLYTH